MSNLVSVSMLSAFATICLISALVADFVMLMIGALSDKVETIVTLAKFIILLVVIATILEVVVVFIK